MARGEHTDGGDQRDMAGRATQSVSGGNAVYYGGVCGTGERSVAVTAAVWDSGGGGDGGLRG